MESMSQGESKSAAAREAGKHRLWLIEQRDVLTERFHPFLKAD
jgi:hypothetical protein